MSKLLTLLFLTTSPFLGIAQYSKNKERAEQTIEVLQKWYDEETGLWATTSWWNAANAITALINYSRITGSSKYLSIIDNTFEVCKNQIE